LFVFNALIHGQENLKGILFGEGDQLAVFLSRPPKFRYRLTFMNAQVLLQLAGDAFVE